MLKPVIYRFSESASLLALFVFMWDHLVLSIEINRSYFQLNASKHGIYRFSWSVSLLSSGHCPFSCAIQDEAIAVILILSLIFYYWHTVLEAVVSDSSDFHCISRVVFECLHGIFALKFFPHEFLNCPKISTAAFTPEFGVRFPVSAV